MQSVAGGLHVTSRNTALSTRDSFLMSIGNVSYGGWQTNARVFNCEMKARKPVGISSAIFMPLLAKSTGFHPVERWTGVLSVWRTRFCHRFKKIILPVNVLRLSLICTLLSHLALSLAHSSLVLQGLNSFLSFSSAYLPHLVAVSLSSLYLSLPGSPPAHGRATQVREQINT